jgi:hypothetical protein
MTTFALEKVRAFAAETEARQARCDNGEGTECMTLDGRMREYAALCRDTVRVLKDWGWAVFTGVTPPDPAIDAALLGTARKLHHASLRMIQFGQKAVDECYMLEGIEDLRKSTGSLGYLLNNWVAPAVATAPTSRRGASLPQAQVVEATGKLAELPPLPPDWVPSNPQQAAVYKQISACRKC